MDIVTRDTAYLRAGIPELKQYLLSKEIYWPLTTREYQLPRLTIGCVLLARTRLQGFNQDNDQYFPQLESLRTSWRVAWEKKAGREYKARLELWKNYLMDYQLAPEQQADAYQHEVRLRTMLHLLSEELTDQPAEGSVLFQLDRVLSSALIRSDFIWENELKKVFPAEVYWYLYGKLKN
jgi:hypothetical protein